MPNAAPCEVRQARLDIGRILRKAPNERNPDRSKGEMMLRVSGGLPSTTACCYLQAQSPSVTETTRMALPQPLLPAADSYMQQCAHDGDLLISTCFYPLLQSTTASYSLLANHRYSLRTTFRVIIAPSSLTPGGMLNTACCVLIAA